MCIWLDISEIYIVVIHILDSFLRLKSHPNIFGELQVWGEFSKIALRNNSQNFHMVLKLIWLGLLSWWRGVRCFSCFIHGRGAWTIIGWVWTTIVFGRRVCTLERFPYLNWSLIFLWGCFRFVGIITLGQKIWSLTL